MMKRNNWLDQQINLSNIASENNQRNHTTERQVKMTNRSPLKVTESLESPVLLWLVVSEHFKHLAISW